MHSTRTEASPEPFASLAPTENRAIPSAATETPRIAPGIGTEIGTAVIGAAGGELPNS